MSVTTLETSRAPRVLWAGRLLMLLLAAAGILLLLSASMARLVTYDEDQYLAAGLLVAQGSLPYRDFVYLQAPLYPFVLAAVFKLSGGWYLLSARMLTFALSVVSAALLWRLLRRLGADRVLCCVLLAACLASPFLASTLANTRNDALPLTLFLGGLLLYFRAADASWWRRCLAALLLGLAVEAKVTYLFGPLAILLHGVIWPSRRLPPVVLGLAVAALPAVLLLGASGWEPMRFGLLDFHLTATPDWYHQQGLEAQLDAAVRLQAVLGWLFLGGNLTLLVLSVALALITMARKRKWKRPGQLLVVMLSGAVVLDFLPAPAWAMYFAVVAPLLACCIAHLDRITTHLADPFRKRVLFLVAALPVVPALLLQGPEVMQFARGDWVGIKAHRTALAVRAALPPAAVARGAAVATLFPHLVMDANPVLVDFASGPFVFRSGDAFSLDRLARLHALSPRTLAAGLARDAPAAIFAGSYAGVFRTAMDQPLTDYADQHGWHLVLTEPDGGRLWLHPQP